MHEVCKSENKPFGAEDARLGAEGARSSASSAQERVLEGDVEAGEAGAGAEDAGAGAEDEDAGGAAVLAERSSFALAGEISSSKMGVSEKSISSSALAHVCSRFVSWRGGGIGVRWWGWWGVGVGDGTRVLAASRCNG